MKETRECPCKKEETTIVRLYDDYGEHHQLFLQLSPQARRLLEFLDDEEVLNVFVDWDFDLASITKEF